MHKIPIRFLSPAFDPNTYKTGLHLTPFPPWKRGFRPGLFAQDNVPGLRPVPPPHFFPGFPPAGPAEGVFQPTPPFSDQDRLPLSAFPKGTLPPPTPKLALFFFCFFAFSTGGPPPHGARLSPFSPKRFSGKNQGPSPLVCLHLYIQPSPTVLLSDRLPLRLCSRTALTEYLPPPPVLVAAAPFAKLVPASPAVLASSSSFD